jgi:Zinc finger, C3HC4 type (RING finger)
MNQDIPCSLVSFIFPPSNQKRKAKKKKTNRRMHSIYSESDSDLLEEDNDDNNLPQLVEENPLERFIESKTVEQINKFVREMKHLLPPLNEREDMDCVICHNILKNPVVHECGQIFCAYCLAQSLSAGSDRSCPSCKGKIPIQYNFIYVKSISALVEDTFMKCPFQLAFNCCGEENATITKGIKYSSFEHHMKSEVRYLCPLLCGEKICLENQIEHWLPGNCKKNPMICSLKSIIILSHRYEEKKDAGNNNNNNNDIVDCDFLGTKEEELAHRIYCTYGQCGTYEERKTLFMFLTSLSSPQANNSCVSRAPKFFPTRKMFEEYLLAPCYPSERRLVHVYVADSWWEAMICNNNIPGAITLRLTRCGEVITRNVTDSSIQPHGSQSVLYH